MSTLTYQEGLKFIYDIGCRGKHGGMNCFESMSSLQNRSLCVYAYSTKEWVTGVTSARLYFLIPYMTLLSVSTVTLTLNFSFGSL